ncbi:MAG: hydrogenase expression/formation protein HypE [Mailhella sp.]|nr:hydrogenase expression/formation protein HypE [Mailhella sp.]
MNILLDAGSGGRASMRLIHELFFKYFENDILVKMDDAAYLEMKSPLAMSTDSYTVSPLFFKGGNIGTLAVHGTVNDVSMLGARPRYLSCGFIIEEGFSYEDLEEIVKSMAQAASEAGVKIVTGDTKVVTKGACDKIFINTTGIGEIIPPRSKFGSPSGANAKAGDVILISGTMGDHGLTGMAERENLSFVSDVQSDSASLNRMIERLMLEVDEVHVLRDPTRGGVATTLNEIAGQSKVRCVLFEENLPVRENVRSGASVLGIDPLYLANEGKLLCLVPKDEADKALAIMKEDKNGKEAALIGEVAELAEGKNGQVVLQTKMGGMRLINMLEGAVLPRIC